MKTTIASTICTFLVLCGSAAEAFDNLSALDRYNVVWTTPSQNAAGSMPIGNGEVGLNVWVEENGDLLFYIARTDSWSECNRLLKLGRIRVSLSPNPFAKGQPFRQELKLRDGQIIITADDAVLKVFVDPDTPVIHVIGESKTPRSVAAKLEIWRTERRVLKGGELPSSWTMRDAPASVEISESADVVKNPMENVVSWHHRNAYSIVPLTLKHQGIESLTDHVKDILANRTFGGWMAGEGLKSDGASVLRSSQPLLKFAVKIATHAAQTESSADWERQTSEIAKKSSDADASARRTAAWWNAFWSRSWVFIGGEKPDKNQTLATQSYILQRWITACAGRGNYPIKFNGSIFTVEPSMIDGNLKYNADWRRWGDCYWWQNTRLPYFPMTMRGDFDQMRSLFRFYRDILPICKARAKLYYNTDGVYFPETITAFGAYSNGDYGWNRKGRKANEVLCPYWQYAWQQGLELTTLMLDYYEHTDDATFLAEELIPMAREVLNYYDSRFKRDANGKLIISPTQSVETYWYGVVNDTPSVAGLNFVLDRLLALPPGAVPVVEREFWKKMKAATPDVPLVAENGKKRVTMAEKFNPTRSNVENPELFAIWPFQCFGVGRPNLEIGVETFLRRTEKASIGWQYDGQSAALVGLADEAKKILLGKIRNSHKNFRFPAMWGPNYDWLPDQDHGCNIMLTAQHMLLASAGDTIFLMPAWPKEWDVSFKLYAPHRTTIECDYRGGKIERLRVTPESRRKDVQLPVWLQKLEKNR